MCFTQHILYLWKCFMHFCHSASIFFLNMRNKINKIIKDPEHKAGQTRGGVFFFENLPHVLSAFITTAFIWCCVNNPTGRFTDKRPNKGMDMQTDEWSDWHSKTKWKLWIHLTLLGKMFCSILKMIYIGTDFFFRIVIFVYMYNYISTAWEFWDKLNHETDNYENWREGNREVEISSSYLYTYK